MALDYFQYQVARIWYRLYWAVMVAFNLFLVGLYVGQHFLPGLEGVADGFAVTNTALAIATTNLFYLCFVYWFVVKYSLPFATLIGTLFLALAELNGLAQTQPENFAYLYVSLWILTTFINGAYGLPILLGSVFVTWMALSLVSNFDPAQIDMPGIVMMAGAVIASTIAYFFWRGRFVSVEAQKVTQLSGMLRGSQHQSEILVQSIADGIVMFNTEGKITLMNPAAATMTGWTLNDANGVDAQLVVNLQKEDGSDVSPEENPFTVALKQREQSNQAYLLADRDGKKITISLVISPVILPGDDTFMGAVAVMRDISEERAAEKQRAEFISTASHEMRTPVAAIEGYLALALNDKVSTIDSRARSYLEKAHSSTQHLGKLFQDLLTSSKAEDGRLTSHPTVVEMGTFMQQLTDDLKFAAEKKGLLAEFIIGGADQTIDATAKDASSQHLVKPLYYAHVDSDRIREVVTNLFDNATKYTDSGKISIGLTGNTDVVQIYVRDTGAGIPKDDVPHLFQKFYRVDNSATRTIGGTGLGLFICRKIVEMYHGRIWVESEVGKGSTFFINLPRLSTQRATELQEAEANLKSSSSQTQKPAADQPSLPKA
ncbi:MAG TPA: ATP-binding protein [Candidatus Saccharimonadales bacterium]|nr:ATP-binding protein [Candidatus Saccharimonadales bacterium]